MAANIVLNRLIGHLPPKRRRLRSAQLAADFGFMAEYGGARAAGWAAYRCRLITQAVLNKSFKAHGRGRSNLQEINISKSYEKKQYRKDVYYFSYLSD